jgi:hypothetical protein
MDKYLPTIAVVHWQDNTPRTTSNVDDLVPTLLCDNNGINNSEDGNFYIHTIVDDEYNNSGQSQYSPISLAPPISDDQTAMHNCRYTTVGEETTLRPYSEPNSSHTIRPGHDDSSSSCSRTNRSSSCSKIASKDCGDGGTLPLAVAVPSIPEPVQNDKMNGNIQHQQQHCNNHHQQQQQQHNNQHYIFCPISNGPSTAKEHIIMFDENLIEEFGIKRVEQFAKKNNVQYRFKSAATCRCEGLNDVIKRKVCKSICYSKLSDLCKRNTVYCAFNLLPIYVTDKTYRIRKQKRHMHRNAMQRFSKKFNVPRKDIIILSINVNCIDNVHLVLPKQNVMSSSLREYKIMDMYTKLCDVMAVPDVFECPPTPGMSLSGL